jgi:hydroxymethylpyrimidine pyrophosphatase-like HAD family hydrolase
VRYHALACDYDGTLALRGRVDAAVVDALERVRRSGRKLVLVTGRTLPDLRRVAPDLALFDRVVAENGALVHAPRSGATKLLGAPASPDFVAALRARGVAPIAVGECIVATWEPHQSAALAAIQELGLELQVIFNKGAVMVLPSSINKATGLGVALLDLGLSPRNAVAIGDAENDHAFLALCECAVAVRNALPALQERADWVTRGDHGAGVVELALRLLENDLVDLDAALARHAVALGIGADGSEIALPAYGSNLLVAGTSGGGKTSFATGLVERLLERGAQLVAIDPEGDYEQLPGTSAIGSAERPPDLDEVMRLVENPAAQLVLNLLGVALDVRPEFFASLFARLLDQRVRTGRPHWLLVDEAHHLLPRGRVASGSLLSPEISNVLWITVHPEHLAPAVVAGARHVVVMGRAPAETLAEVARAFDAPAPHFAGDLAPGEAVHWTPGSAPLRMRTIPSTVERRRHVRKYADGELPPDRSFYFRGPEAKLRLRASNLTAFLDLGDGVDDATWLHHLERGDYSRWIRLAIKDEELAGEIAAVETMGGSAATTRTGVRRAIEARYTAPA